MNEAIANDMQPDINEKLTPLVESCGRTLLQYQHLAVGSIVMDGSILTTGEFEVMLSKGLGRFFVHNEKERLFQDAKHISDLLTEVMDRGSKN